MEMNLFSSGTDKLEKYRIELDYPYTPSIRTPFPIHSFTFANATSSSTLNAAKQWIGPERLTSSVFTNAIRIAWSSLPFAATFAQTMANLGATVQVAPTPQEKDMDVLVGMWTLSDGKPFLVFGEAWCDQSTGHNFLFWHFDALIRTRPSVTAASPNPKQSTALPKFFTAAWYLSETPTTINHSNKISRKDHFATEFPPKIAFHTEVNHFHAALAGENGNQEIDYFWTPETIRYGYIFDEVKDLSDMESAISEASSALPKVADILVDGFSNYQGLDAQSFQGLCAAVFKSGNLKNYEKGIFIPGPIHIDMDMQSIYIYSVGQQLFYEALQSKKKDQLLVAINAYQEVFTKGTGASVVHALNTYVYAQMNYGVSILGLSKESMVAFRDYGATLLKYASAMPVDLQDANALSNLALLEISRENYDAAIEAVALGIAKLKEDRRHYPQSLMGNSAPEANPQIKLELFATKAELIYRSGDKAKAKELAMTIQEEAQALNYEGPEIAKARWILAH